MLTRQARAIAFVTTASLGLGIAVTTTVFSFVNAIQFKTLKAEG